MTNEKLKRVMILLKRKLAGEAEVTANNAIWKPNDLMFTGITLRRPGEPVGMTYYLTDEHEKWSDGAIVSVILKKYRNANKTPGLPDFTKYDAVKQYLTLRLVKTSWNQGLLFVIPHKNFLDFGVIVSLLIIGGERTYNTEVGPELLSAWNKTFDEVFRDAMENFLHQRTTLNSLEAVLDNMGCERQMPDLESTDIFVLSDENMAQSYGSSRMLDRTFFMQLALKFESDILVLPSSVHELIIMPVGGNADNVNLDGVDEMVRLINVTHVNRSEWLSDHLYIFRVLGEWDMNFIRKD